MPIATHAQGLQIRVGRFDSGPRLHQNTTESKRLAPMGLICALSEMGLVLHLSFQVIRWLLFASTMTNGKPECNAAGKVQWPNPSTRKPTISITGELVAQYRYQRLKQVSNNTVRLELAFLSVVFEQARKAWGLAVSNPVGQIRMPKPCKPRTRRLEAGEEVARLTARAASGAHCLHSLVVLAMATGLPKISTKSIQKGLARLFSLQASAMLAGGRAGFWGAVWLAKPFFTELIRCFPGNRNAIFFGRTAQILVKRCKWAAQFLGQQQIGGVVGRKPLFKCFDGQWHG